MSLIVNGSSAASFDPIEEGTHVAVCYMLVDLGMQYSEQYKTKSRKVLIGWEIPDETIELEDGPHPRTLSKQYTASLNESANLRQDLAAWRGRDFTGEELEAFDLRSIVGKTCLINVVHKQNNGKTYANIQSIMALPKGMPKAKISDKAMVYDIDHDPPEAVDLLPKWIQDRVKKSESYQDRLYAAPKQEEFQEVADDESELPF